MNTENSALVLYMLLQDIYYYERGIYNIIENMVRFKPQNKYDLMNAINSWACELNHHYAFIWYGPIEIWNTELITDMSYLFQKATKIVFDKEKSNFSK